VFVGHLALAFAAKPRLPSVSLGWLVAAVSTLDLLWPLLLIAGVEHVRIQPGATPFTPLVFTAYPWSHSLLTAIVWGIALAALARLRGVPGSAFVWLAALVVSHWVLDWITHVPDMPLWPAASSPHLGLDWHVGSQGFVLAVAGPAVSRLGINLLALLSWLALRLR